MMDFSPLELREAHRALLSTLRKCEKMDPAKLGKSQRTLLERRISALRVALALIGREQAEAGPEQAEAGLPEKMVGQKACSSKTGRA